MKYYHGTSVYFKSFDLSYSGTYKDFGVGAYLSEKKSHAESVAIWKNQPHAFVYTYECSLSELRKIFKILEFRSASIDYLKYIISNRTSIVKNDYDIIIGPTVDASAQSIIQNFIEVYKRPTVKDYNNLRNALILGRYPTQICLKTKDALSYFDNHRIKEEVLK